MVGGLIYILLFLSKSVYSAYGPIKYHRSFSNPSFISNFEGSAELSAKYWIKSGRAHVLNRVSMPPSARSARNLVLFVGDGMSVATLASARAYLGQQEGGTGEEAQLSFETFPTVGLSKTYCVDAQVADSACTSTAYLCGVKTNVGTLGVSARVKLGNCSQATQKKNQVNSIAGLALMEGRDAGIVTTTRVTHASPAGAYCHSAHRDWESDANMPAHCNNEALKQKDIALQLVKSFPGTEFKVILGGGRQKFLPNTKTDEDGNPGVRLDGRDLIKEWKQDKSKRNVSHKYVWNREQLLDESNPLPEYLLGLFAPSHMQYNLLAGTNDPTLTEMTETAIKSLSRNKKGFFLFVEGGRIDHAHHENYARLALDETVEMSKAIARARELLDPNDSLIVVTSDHSHVMTYNGYSKRGNDILGVSDEMGQDKVPYTTLSYANGPGYRIPTKDGKRQDVTKASNFDNPDFRFPAAVPLESETHGGEDVAVFSSGPRHDLFSGVIEQHTLPYLMSYIGCLGPRPNACDESN